MSLIAHVRQFTLPAAASVLPETMDTPAARAMLLAIGLQESRFLHRQQIKGPARGFWQFELGGVRGVMNHHASKAPLTQALQHLNYSTMLPADALHQVITHNDTLAAVVARLLLFTLPAALPGEIDVQEGWRQYLDGWRPGKPHPETWAGFYRLAWDHVEGRR